MLARKRAARLAAQAAEPISPYCTDPWTLLIGPKRTKYTVLSGILSKHPQFKGNREISQSSSTVELPEVCEDAGHTLVHYLYTGTYETLQSKDTEDKTAELRRNAHLYGIATKYDLTGLKLLAQTEIEKTQGVVAIIDFLNIAKDVFQILLEKDDWFTLHVKAEIERALEVDESLFRNIGFLELVGEVKSFDKFLVEIMGRIYIDNIAVMARKTQSPTNTSSSKLAFTPESSSISANEKSYDEPLFEGLAESTTLENPALCDKTPLGKDFHYETISSEAVECEAVECEETPHGRASKKEKKKGKKGKGRTSESQIEPIPVPEPEPEPAHYPLEEACVECHTEPEPAHYPLEEACVECHTESEPAHYPLEEACVECHTEPNVQENVLCVDRAEHLRTYDSWAHCRKCCAMIHQLSLRIPRNMAIDERRF